MSARTVPMSILLLVAACGTYEPAKPVASLQVPVPTPPGHALATDPAWVATVQSRIRATAHRFRGTGGAFDAGAGGLAAHFDADGLAVTRAGSPAIRLHTTGFGRPDQVELAGGGAPALGGCQDALADVQGNCIRRLEYEAGPSLTEWWSARSDGLEQGWDIPRRPGGHGGLVLDVTVEGADVSASPGSVRLQGEEGLVIVVASLSAVDARGAFLPARFEHAGDGFRVVVDDAGAAYPIVVDPTYSTPGWSVEGDPGYLGFGRAVAQVGDVNGDGFEDVVVADGNAADPDSESSADKTGCAYLFEGSGTGLSDRATLTFTPPSSDGQFGRSVDGAGDLNADGYDDVIIGSAVSGGAAYVYFGAATGPGADPDVTLTGVGTNTTVAGVGDVNADGYGDLAVGSTSSGVVAIYDGSSTGVSATAATTLTEGASSVNFGTAIDGAGDVNGDGYDDLVVGTNATTATAYVYHGSATGLSATAAATLPFGAAVAGVGDVNADGYDDVVTGLSGSSVLYYFPGSATGVGATPSLAAHGTASYLGTVVSGSGDVNGDGYMDVAGSDREHTYVFAGGATGLGTTAIATLSGEIGTPVMTGAGDVNGDGYSDVLVTATDTSAFVYWGAETSALSSSTETVDYDPAWFGYSVSSAGDVNGDGYGDVIIGAPTSATYQTEAGKAYVFEGSVAGLSTVASTTLTARGCPWFGQVVAGVGDTNADGFDDVAVAASYDCSTSTDLGELYVYAGSATGVADAPMVTIGGIDDLGEVLLPGGDVDGDGYADFLAATDDFTETFYVFAGSASGTLPEPRTTIDLHSSSNRHHLSAAGDVDGDGYDDVIVGFSYSDPRVYGPGKVYLYRGQSTGLSSVISATLSGAEGDGLFGNAIAAAGDINADGYDDIVVYGGTSSPGAVNVFLGAVYGFATTPSQTLVGTTSGDAFGRALAGLGDANGDGYDDVAIGASPTGSAAPIGIYAGSPTGLGLAPLATITDPDLLASSPGMTGAGDVNGDGLPDLLLGSHEFGQGGGLARVYHMGPDVDGDGIVASDDCDDSDASVAGPTAMLYADVDGDGHGDPGSQALVCDGAVGYAVDSTDCDDANAAVHPDADEICDGLDNDCEGTVDVGAIDMGTWYPDADADGYTTPSDPVIACTAPVGHAPATIEDCDDTDPAIHPGATDTAGDGIDQDCDGSDASGGPDDTAGDSGTPPPAATGCSDGDSGKSGGCSVGPDASSLALGIAAAALLRRRRAGHRASC